MDTVFSFGLVCCYISAGSFLKALYVSCHVQPALVSEWVATVGLGLLVNALLVDWGGLQMDGRNRNRKLSWLRRTRPWRKPLCDIYVVLVL